MSTKKKASLAEGQLLWQPSEKQKEQTNLYHYMTWLNQKQGLNIKDYHELWSWSVENMEDFWSSLWEYFNIQAKQPYSKVLSGGRMPDVRWFEGATLNYSEHVFRYMRPKEPAIFFASELRQLDTLSWQELYDQVASMAAGLKAMGVRPGDRVAAYMPNIPETVVAFLATASLGAIWSSCSPEFGSSSVIDRFKQIEPKVLLAVDGYRYGGKDFNCFDRVKQIQAAIPSLEKTVLLQYLGAYTDSTSLTQLVRWEEVLAQHQGAELKFEQVPFDQPLWVLYSSGTTGLPKAIVQGHGGILLEHLKLETFHLDLKPEDRLFWFTTTGWMMWNVVVSGLLTGASIILFDGNPGYPDLNVLWELAEQTQMTVFGTSASFLTQCMNHGLEPGQHFNLNALKTIGSTGSPLSPEGFKWVYEHVKSDLWLASVSGGTDLCSAFVGGVPLLPVHAGELQGRALGAHVQTFDESGRAVIDQVGELVITDPMPSMPLYLWGDHRGERYRETYFNMYPGIWKHGDWMKITPRGTCVIYGRSDSTINRGGVRIGSSEIYSAVESMAEVSDSLVIDLQEESGKGDSMPLFVVLNEGFQLDEDLKKAIKQCIRENCSPRHVPDDIYAIEQVPRTLNGKKLEVPVKRIIMGGAVEQVVSKDALQNPASLDYFIQWRQKYFAQ
ncbi:acetoacetyl-CoA synthetase [Caldalkalibacillus uzonensis]|uniref:Acetoacetyl-CoA synthetase n=1 Tax=Caldalkalibacillus uzonensis TaxID=353224 RepID=A0ABU0CXZ7_9BACI|nr:acetoacetate--CoA ligase [Caldalkalibacillus uzonensis]MDQ0341029.1 acetoacetyl-CoA synthetase [Caldalkalibacillus uzonensis]